MTARHHNRMTPHLELDLICSRPKGEVLPFRVEIHADALNQLINLAWEGLGLYELFSIQRPGDIKHYLWVKIIEASRFVAGVNSRLREEFDQVKYGPPCPWPEQFCPFVKFDDLFFYCGDDTEEETASWRNMADGENFQKYLELCLAAVRDAQQGIAHSGDLVSRHEVKLIKEERHPSRFLADLPRTQILPGFTPPSLETHRTEFYECLGKLLKLPDVQSVAYRYGRDYRTFRMFCIEQRERADASGKEPRQAFPISVGNEGLPQAAPWGNEVLYYDEGLGYGDLLVDPKIRTYDTMKELIESGYRQGVPYILTLQDLGEIAGYDKEDGEGFCLYTLKVKNLEQ